MLEWRALPQHFTGHSIGEWLDVVSSMTLIRMAGILTDDLLIESDCKITVVTLVVLCEFYVQNS